MRPYIKKIRKPLSVCEQLFDKKVLEIKKLAKDIGNLTPLIHKEQKNYFFLYDDSNIIVIHVLPKLTKRSNVMDLFHYNTTMIMRKL